MAVVNEQLIDVFCRNLRRIRAEAGLSQNALAKKAKIPQSYLSDIEGSKTSPTLTTIARLAEALEVAPYVLLFDQVQEDEWVFGPLP